MEKEKKSPEITEVTKLQSNINESKVPLRVPEALNLLVLETMSDHGENPKKSKQVKDGDSLH